MLYSSLRALARVALGWYYESVEVEGIERIPTSGPVFLAGNHPNALMDALVIGVLVPRPVHLLAKATLFENPVMGAALRAVGVIPLQRTRDSAHAPAPAVERNAQSFRAVAEVLAADGAVVIFPEGTSHDNPQLAPLRTGLARMALEARDQHAVRGITIVPLGLVFEAKETPRSRVLLQVGEPLQLDAVTDAERTVSAVTAGIEQRLRDVTLNFSSPEESARILSLAHALGVLFTPTQRIGAESYSLANVVHLVKRVHRAASRITGEFEIVDGTPVLSMRTTGSMRATGSMRDTGSLGPTDSMSATGSMGTTDSMSATGSMGTTGSMRTSGSMRISSRDVKLTTRVQQFEKRLAALLTQLSRAELALEDVNVAPGGGAGMRFAMREGLLALVRGPVGLWGRVNHWIPITLTRALALRGADPSRDQPAMRSVVFGVVLVLAFYALQTGLVAWLSGGWWALGYALTLIPSASSDFRYGDRTRRARARMRAYFRFRKEPALQRSLMAEADWLRTEAVALEALILETEQAGASAVPLSVGDTDHQDPSARPPAAPPSADP